MAAWNEHWMLARALLPDVLRAAHAIRQLSGAPAEAKADGSPVTLADRAAEAILTEALARELPGVPLVAEEAMSSAEAPPIGDTFLLVDPLDGTREFVKGGADYTINVALIVHGTPVFGIIAAPEDGRLFLTTGVRQAQEGRLPIDLNTRIATREAPPPVDAWPLSEIRSRRAPSRSLVVVSSRSDVSPPLEAALARLPIAWRLPIGSSLKFCLIARGDADLYPRLGSISEWDTAAGHAIVLAAGGCVTMLDGEPLTYGKVEKAFRNPAFVAWASPQPLPGVLAKLIG